VEKDNIIQAFSRGEIDILVSTTVIEVGIDVPAATLMVIEQAERFGLAQLHQLRGRVGRGAKQSYCILLGNPQTEEALQRIKAMEATNDGFILAQEDLKIRGPGEFLGVRQHGLLQFKIADLSVILS
jgi:ATP-dependent DNA helicase RecG